jgi:hypothetical protein
MAFPARRSADRTLIHIHDRLLLNTRDDDDYNGGGSSF